ncbi:PREDICTED: uncharacterized protein LOC109335401 [Lupinus angustifolius]|uniref:uncharacterized protein LOC109335401 n=1 Tax=Lupinus angustifolius TaxID=3871 RepID=UPI00092F9E1F|nr:PREDICTED: uncharacterized protein LOC109335401 [Lupinus angustifolius]
MVIDPWFEDKDFVSFVEQNWNEFSPSGWSMFVLKEKLKLFKAILKKWNKMHFRDINNKIDLAVVGIHDLDLKSETMYLSKEDLRIRLELSTDLWRARSLQQNLNFQKSRSKWLKEGDNNSKFFHGLMNHRKRPNSIHGQWIEDVHGVRQGIRNHFENLFNEHNRNRPTLSDISFNQLEPSDNVLLIANFDDEEIKNAI